MQSDFQLLPEQASNFAGEVDALFWLLVLVTGFFIVLISALNFVFAVRFRRSRSPVAKPVLGSIKLELAWSIIPLIIGLGVFAWGADLYYDMYNPPDDAHEIYAVGKQWMWKFQHPEGKREINDLHLPVGIPIKVTMTSEDVIHSFFVPAFRTKNDVLPGRYTKVWFIPTKVGQYHLFCTEYCGTKHSEMIGTVHVMEVDDYEKWVSDDATRLSMAEAGGRLFQAIGCQTCHSPTSGERGPDLAGVYGSEQALKGGRRALVTDAYLRESILNPNAKLTEGYEPLMPSFQGQISEEDLLQIIAYIRSLKTGTEGDGTP